MKVDGTRQLIVVLNYYLSEHETHKHLPNSGAFHKSEVVEHYISK